MRRRSDRGAAAVEFALVAPFLFLVLFGIIDYGTWFADSITVRQTAADGARRAAAWPDGVPAPWVTGSATLDQCGAWDAGVSAEIQALGCSMTRNAPTLLGPVYVKVRILDPTLTQDVAGSNNWKGQNAVRICVLQLHGSISGLIPMPSDVITTHTDMPIEGVSGRTLTAGGQVLPSGVSWPAACRA